MSSAVDEDTLRTINSGRETIGDVLSNAQSHLQKIFIVFVIGFMGSFYALRLWVWDFLRATAEAEMDANLAGQTDVITLTPFEVILLQAKIGAIVGAIVSIPAVLFFAREPLKRRGYESAIPISKASVVGFVLTSLSLFVIGVVYAYGVFFPFAFEFLASNATQAGIKPDFGITQLTEFMALLTFSFGLAAQLPLFMGALAYTEIVPYETFVDKWRHSVVAITVFGALFSPPDPFTLIMWAIPLVVLYVFSLGLAKLLTNVRRKGAAEAVGEGGNLVRRRLLQFGGVLALTAIGTAVLISYGALEYADEDVFPLLPEFIRPSGPTLFHSLSSTYGFLGDLASGLIVAIGLGFVVLLGFAVSVLKSPVYPRMDQIRTGDPSEIDIDVLDVDGIEAAPPEVFLEMDEETALDHARSAMYDEDREKAQAILDRFDTLQDQAQSDEDVDGAGGGASAGDAAGPGGEEESGSFFSSTAANMLDPFTEDETTEDDIGGYAYDIAFILQSLTSRMFRIVAVFMIVMGGTFMGLYSGGLQIILEQFVNNVPEDLLNQIAEANGADLAEIESTMDLIAAGDFVIALHPVEVLIFEVKVSVLAAIVAILPMVLYYSWPAMKERGLVRGDRRTFVVWGGAMLGGFALGTYLGFFWIAPGVISYLIADAVSHEMVISYRIKHFIWLVLFTTVGIGFLVNIVVSMALFHVGGIVPYRSMLGHWRVVVVGIFTFAALASPSGILTMLIFAIPITITYLIGLAILYVFTAGGRFGGGERKGPDFDTGLLGR